MSAQSTLRLPNGKHHLLLHSCCAPCSGAVMEAILAINSSANVSYKDLETDDETIASIDWKDTTPISADDIKAKMVELAG